MNPIKELPDDPRIPAIAVIRGAGLVAPDGQCTADSGRVFTDRFSISDGVRGPGLSPGNGRALRLRML